MQQPRLHPDGAGGILQRSRASSPGAETMTITVEAIYEDGVLKPAQSLPLKEHATVTLTIHTGAPLEQAGIIPCTDPQLIEWAAMDPELEYPPSPEEP